MNKYERDKARLIERFFKAWDKLMKQVENRLNETTQKFIQNNIEVDAQGNLKPTIQNLNQLQKFDAIFEKEYQRATKVLVDLFVKELKRSVLVNTTYLKDVVKTNVSSQRAEQVLNRRLGLTSTGRVQANGFLGSIIQDKSIMFDVKKTIERNISNGKNFKDTSIEVKQSLEGIPEKRRSLVRAQVDTTIKDTFIENDRIALNEQAKQYGLVHFIYAGTIVERSRCFCIKHVGKVFSVSDTEQWRDEIGGECGPVVGLSGESVEEKKNNYIPMEDMGGWGCLHVARYINSRTFNKMNK